MFAPRTLLITFVAVLMGTSVALAEPPVRQMPEKKGWFGIGLEAADAAQQKKAGVDRAVPRVTKIFRGSPAETAGIQKGDLILEFEGHPIQNVADLVQRVGATAPGAQVTFVVFREGRGRFKQPVVLDLRKDMQELFKQEWLGRAMPKVGITGVRQSDGARIDLSPAATQGKVVVIDYFATWCGPCKRVMPELEALQKRYADKGLMVVGVSGEEMEVVRPFVEQRKLAYAVGVDVSGEFREHLTVSVLPTVWVVDRQGMIREITFGAGQHPTIEAAVQKALGVAPSKRH